MHRSLSILTMLIAVGCHSFHNEPPTLQSPTVGAGGPTFIAPGSGSNLLFQSPQGMQQIAANDPNASRSIVIPVTNEDYTWELIVDTVDDYFDVDQEHRVQLVGNVVTEGRIETFPQIGGTLLEPHRRDSVGRYNLVESTFQSVRRRAEIRVMPQQGGWLVEAIVYKEFEDLARPENATAGAASFRFDSSIPSRIDESVSRTKLSKYWIPMGRDCEIETLMLLDLQERIANPPQPHH